MQSVMHGCKTFILIHVIKLTYMYSALLINGSHWVPSKIGPFIQLVNISDLTYTMYILYYTTLSMTHAFYLVDKIE